MQDVAGKVAFAGAVDRAARDAQEWFGRVDVLVNNAGIGLIGPVSQATRADWDWIIDVNIKGVVHGLQAFLPLIRAHGEGGHIVNTASMGGLLPVSAGLYCLTKAGIIALSETLHIELAPENIGVSAYIPGPVHSNLGASSAARPDQYAGSGYPALNAFPDEPVNAERAAAITFLTSHPVYREAARRPACRLRLIGHVRVSGCARCFPRGCSGARPASAGQR